MKGITDLSLDPSTSSLLLALEPKARHNIAISINQEQPTMKAIPFVLIALLAALQYRLWFGKNSMPQYLAMQQEVREQTSQNTSLEQRNNLLEADINDLKIGLEAAEERARNELGLIKQGETFYRILPNEE